MKKTLISLEVVGTLLGSTNLMASDSTALTKAVVKLIKANQAIETKVGGINNYSEVNAEGITKNGANISKLEAIKTIKYKEYSISKIKAIILYLRVLRAKLLF